MRILLINKFHYLRGGAERAYFDTARILRAHGHEVAFFSMTHPENRETQWSKHFVSEADFGNVERYTFMQRMRLALRLLWSREAQKKLETLISDFQPDVAHLHNIYHQLSPSILWTLHAHRVPTVMTLHDHKLICPQYNMFVRGAVWEKKPWQCVGARCIKNSLLKSMLCVCEHYLHKVLKTFDKVDAYIAPSHYLIEKFSKYNFQQEITHIGQPITTSTERVQNADESSASKELLVFGRLDPGKGFDTVIAALGDLPNHTLTVCGDGPYRTALEKIAEQSGVAERVSFAGFCEKSELQKRIDGAAAVIVPSLLNENMPYALLEALERGAIVIASESGGNTERVVDRKNGFLFPAGNTHALVKKIKESEQINPVAVGRAARASVADLTEEQYYTSLMKLYTKIRES